MNIVTLSIFIIWLFHLSGIIGIVYFDAGWFLSMTPLNLSINFALLVITSYKSNNFLKILTLSFFLGFISEFLGVNYDLIFGDYIYGSALGPKLFGVPILICCNWSVLTICSGAIAKEFSKNFFVKIFIGMCLMLFLDLLMEPLAPPFDFWIFKGGMPTLQNYLGWFFVSLPMHFFYHYWKVDIRSYFCHNLFFVQFLFFMVLLLRINSIEI